MFSNKMHACIACSFLVPIILKLVVRSLPFLLTGYIEKLGD